jgi:hypothetical protein
MAKKTAAKKATKTTVKTPKKGAPKLSRAPKKTAKK